MWPCPSHQSAYCLPSVLMIIVKQLVYIIRPLVHIITKAFCLLHALALSLLDFLWRREVGLINRPSNRPFERSGAEETYQGC